MLTTLKIFTLSGIGLRTDAIIFDPNIRVSTRSTRSLDDLVKRITEIAKNP